ncbi:hypothetical protein DFH27DRAFT_257986 [Peziza echinospora]|nr:hypothetical protein DFH27DRAFT_257986 [Peziza echinospora]
MALTKSLSRRMKDGESGKRKTFTKLQISAPIELVSTTNMISYTAPALPRGSPLSATSTSPSSSPITRTSSSAGRFPKKTASSDIDSASSASNSPPISPTAAPNHLSSYFAPLSQVPQLPPMSPARSLSTRSNASTSSGQSSSSSNNTASKPKRSASSASSSSRSNRKSGGSGSTSAPPRSSHHRAMHSNPFGAELAKVSEIAEEYGVNVNDMEYDYMCERGLQRFAADDYLAEIGGIYADEVPALTAGWI